MNNPTPNELKRASEFIRNGRLVEARAILVDFIKQNPGSDHAWSLMSFVVNEPEQQMDCLRRALRINPNNFQAQARLNQLTLAARSPDPRPAQTQVSPFVIDKPLAGRDEEFTPAARTAPVPTIPTPPLRENLLTPAASTGHPGSTRKPPVSAAGQKAAKAKGPGALLWIGVAFLGLLIVGGAAGIIFTLQSQANQEYAAVQLGLAQTPSITPYRTLPPTWTITATPTFLPTSTPRPTKTPTATPTYISVNPTTSFQMEKIEKQVADLRGLPIKTSIPHYILPINQAEMILRGLLTDEDIAELGRQQRVLSMLGLIKPTYDMVRLTLNHMADNIGGFFIPSTKEIFVLGIKFGGIEHYIYSHEYDHALVDQSYDLSGFGVYPFCALDRQWCQAITALVEGDATLLMDQWWNQYASPQDYQDIFNYNPPMLTLPEEFAPPYVIQDVSFPYVQGYNFVNYLHKRGNWNLVNQAYQNLPLSTEQILHPLKYLASEKPLPVTAPALDGILGSGWEMQDNNILGEWTTYMILGYSADLASQIDPVTAEKAAAGWGGDRYQAYYNAELDANVLAIQWVWDTQADAGEFRKALVDHLDKRFRGSSLEAEQISGSCWEANSQTTCVYSTDRQTLWLIAPDLATLNLIRSQYPDF